VLSASSAVKHLSGDLRPGAVQRVMVMGTMFTVLEKSGDLAFENRRCFEASRLAKRVFVSHSLSLEQSQK